MSSRLRILCSRVLHHHQRIIKQQQQQVIPCSFPLSRRNYHSSDDDTEEEELDGITSRLESLYHKFHDRLLALRDDRIKRAKSTAHLDHHLARLAVMDSDDDDDDFLDDDSDDDDDYDQEAQLKEERRRQKMMDHFDKLRTSYNKHIQNGGAPMEAYEYIKKMLELKKKITVLRMEYVVIQELMDRLKVAEGKDKFLLQMKLNRAVRIARCREKFDPHNPINYGVIQNAQNQFASPEDDADKVKDGEDEGFDDMREKDTVLVAKLSELDKQLEQKLADLEHTFGKKGKLLEEEIKDLAEERNSLTEKKGQPLYRKGFDVKLIDVNRTCKVTKGGQIAKYTVMLACGNYNGAVGFAKAKGPAVPVALQKAREKCFQNLHYIERHEEHTIAHAIHISYNKTKVYLWPAPAQTGIRAGRIVQTILNLAGFKNVKSKVVGSRNPHNTVKAVFKALNAIETPKDVQEQFGRTVVESYLL